MAHTEYQPIGEQEAKYVDDLLTMPFSQLDNIVIGMLASAYSKTEPRYLLAMQVFNQRYADQKPD